MACLSENDAVELVDGGLLPDARATAELHLDTCDACRRLISGLAQRSFDASATSHAAGSGAWSFDSTSDSIVTEAGDIVLPPGHTLDRYVLLEPIGAGGMGIVYAAYDPRLKRKIALKLVRLAGLRSDGARAAALGDRLVREAQAMARLSHPNVTTVYDAGSHGTHVFIAMQLVEGDTLRAWLDERPRNWREILGAFIAAGRGLAAAHAVDVVHRDFKPANVLVGGDGRVSVSDFGLARAGDLEPEAPALGSDRASTTRPGAPIGTPAYMAPEQRRDSRAADARSDQYSFCASLHEALWGARGQGESRRGRVPRRLRHVLDRGLSNDPAERFPSMPALLAALERVGHSARSIAIAALALCTVAAIAIVPRLSSTDPSASVCKGAAGKLSGIWDDGRKQAVRAALLRHAATYAPTTANAVERTLDSYAQGWIAMHTEACEATAVRHDQAESVLAVRMTCLEQRRQDLEQAVAYLADSSTPLAGAHEVAAALPAVARCADLPALAQLVPPPIAGAATDRVAEIHRRLAYAKAQSDAGQYGVAAAAATALLDEAHAIGYAPLVAELYFRIGVAEHLAGHAEQAEQALDAAILAGEAGRDDDLVATATALEVTVVGYAEGRHDDGIMLVARADAAIARLATVSPRLAFDAEGKLLASRAALAFERRDLVAAVELEQDAIRHAEQTAGRDAPETVRLHANLASSLETLGRHDDALAQFEQTEASLKATEGIGHPDLIQLDSNIAVVLDHLGRHVEAASRLERALHAAETNLGANDRTVMATLERLSAIRLAQGNAADALTLIDRALAIRAALPASSVTERIAALSERGAALGVLGQTREAETACRTAIAEGERALGPTNRALVLPLQKLGTLAIMSGEPRNAIALLERALAIADGTDGSPQLAAELRFEVATVLVGSGQRVRGIALARVARAAMVDVRSVAAVDRFLADNGERQQHP